MWKMQPAAPDVPLFDQRIQQRLRRVMIAGVALAVGVLALFAAVWLKLPGMGLLLGVDILLVWAVGVLDQNWRRCPRCDFSFVPSMIRMEVEDSRECPECGLNLDLLKTPPL